MAKKVDDRFLSVSEVADYLGCDRITVQNMLRDGRLKAYTLGTRMLRIRLSDIESALQPYGGVTIMPRVKEKPRVVSPGPLNKNPPRTRTAPV